MDYQKYITDLRKDLGFTQEKMARFLGCSQANISEFEAGVREVGAGRKVTLRAIEFITRHKLLKKFIKESRF